MDDLPVTFICKYIFSGFGILCILLVLNFALASQLMIFMMVFSNIQFLQVLIFALLCKSEEMSNISTHRK